MSDNLLPNENDHNIIVLVKSVTKCIHSSYKVYDPYNFNSLPQSNNVVKIDHYAHLKTTAMIWWTHKFHYLLFLGILIFVVIPPATSTSAFTDDYWNNHAPSVNPTVKTSSSKFQPTLIPTTRTTQIPTRSPSFPGTLYPTISSDMPPISFISTLEDDGWCDRTHYPTFDNNVDQSPSQYDVVDCCEDECMRNSRRQYDCGVAGYNCLESKFQGYSLNINYTTNVGNITNQNIHAAQILLLIGIDSLFIRTFRLLSIYMEYKSALLEILTSQASPNNRLITQSSLNKNKIFAKFQVFITVESNTQNATMLHEIIVTTLEQSISDGALQRNVRYYANRYFQPDLQWITICNQCSNIIFSTETPVITNHCSGSTTSDSDTWKRIYGGNGWFVIYIVVLVVVWILIGLWAAATYLVPLHTHTDRCCIPTLLQCCVILLLITQLIYWILILTYSTSMWNDAYCNEIAYFNGESHTHTVLAFLHATVNHLVIFTIIVALSEKTGNIMLLIPSAMFACSIIELILYDYDIVTNDEFGNSMDILQTIGGVILLTIGVWCNRYVNFIQRCFFIMYGLTLILTTINVVRYSPILYLVLHTMFLYLLDITLMIWLIRKIARGTDYEAVDQDLIPSTNQRILPSNYQEPQSFHSERLEPKNNIATVPKGNAMIASDRIFEPPQRENPNWILHWGSCMGTDESK